jgi:hypothetical protein
VTLQFLDNNKQVYSFPRVFDSSSSQGSLYNHAMKPIVEGDCFFFVWHSAKGGTFPTDVFRGHNGFVICYGPTGAGAPHTFGGDGGLHRVAVSKAKKQTDGFIPRMVETLFQLAMSAAANVEIAIRLSFVEVFRDSIFDLLANDDIQVCALDEDVDAWMEKYAAHTPLTQHSTSQHITSQPTPLRGIQRRGRGSVPGVRVMRGRVHGSHCAG